MYQLYFKKHQEFKIAKLKKVFELRRKEFEDKINESYNGWYQFNNCYIFANDRKVLESLAQQMKDIWIMDLSIELEEVKNIKI